MSTTGHADSAPSTAGAQAGFTLLEIVCVLAIVALLAAVALPAVPRATSRPMLEGYALRTATLLKADRDAAVRRGAEIRTNIDASDRSVRSGATGQLIKIPADVQIRALLASRCNGRASSGRISFFQTGMSCGGTITLTRPGGGYQVRVNWLTGGVEVVAINSL